MFGALNRFISRLDSDGPPQRGQNTEGGFGFQVLRNTNSDVPIEPWFDFLVGINGRLIVNFQISAFQASSKGRQDEPDPRLLAQEIRNCAGSSVTLDLWSAKGSRTHTLTLPIPNPYPSSGLGLTLQYTHLSITAQIYHILTIPSPLSPAYLAGLLPHSDYILGSPSGLLHGESGLGELVEDYLGRELKLWVYNSEFDVVREVEITPRRGWGGEGALGAVLGFGALHRLPVPIGEEVQAPGEIVFDHSPPGSRDGLIEQEEPTGDFLVPANMIASPPPQIQHQVTPPPLVSPNVSTAPPIEASTGAVKQKGRRPHHHHGGASPNAFDQLFAESEKKSKEADFVPSRKGTPAAPPPKIGGGGPPTTQSPQPLGNEDDE